MTSETIDLRGLDKGAVVAALYNASRPLGMGFLAFDPKPMTAPEGTEFLKQSKYFDYLKGRVMKINLSGDDLAPWGYDRDNGPGAAAKAIEALRASANPAAPGIVAAGQAGVIQAAREAERLMGTKSTTKTIGGIAVVEMTLDDVKDVLSPAVSKAIEESSK